MHVRRSLSGFIFDLENVSVVTMKIKKFRDFSPSNILFK